ncbi:MAG TPA: class I SAM-dependent methyltransferase [Actinophytocola sp.]|jgi:ubiquinone/menaquinone biosynthesis C-methylase UbiE|uniref:class I SAM-dependent methyltransferase n=1 Tax=Actinophytocola sp. TaxID=1872138 RepID=UPI002F9302DD
MNETTALLGSLRGTVLEIGPGAGTSLRHYAPQVRWIGVEPNARRRDLVRSEADRLGRHAEVRSGRAERLDQDDGSVDAVVATFVLCSVSDQAAALGELFRVLRPGGRYVFAEHVAAPRGTWLRRAQHVATALGALTGDRCRADRDTLPAIERAGFDVVELRLNTRAGPFGVAIPHIAGAAVRPAHTGEDTR